MRTHYQTLGLAQEANTEQIKRCYRSLVKRFHPDLFPSGSPAQAEAELRLREIIAAYTVLSNAGKRASYDARLHQRASSFEELKPEYCRRCGRPTLHWQIGRDEALCDGCDKPAYV